MATKKLIPVKPELKKTEVKSETNSFQQDMLLELQKQTEYLHRIDWKLWMIMNMTRTIGEENGYKFSVAQRQEDNSQEEM